MIMQLGELVGGVCLGGGGAWRGGGGLWICSIIGR